MGFLKPRIETQQPKSQATPLAEDILGLLQKQITGGTFGEGIGPLQREAGTALRQFMNSGAGGRFTSGTNTDFVDTSRVPGINDSALPGVRDINLLTADPRFDLNSQLGNIEQLRRRQGNQQVADLREAFGAAGTRFGSSLGQGEASLREGLDQQLGVELGNLFMAADESSRANRALDLQGQATGANRDIAVRGQDIGVQEMMNNLGLALNQLFGQQAGLSLEQDRINQAGFEGQLARQLQSIFGLQEFGNQNVSPALGLAQGGVLPENQIVTDSPYKTGIELFTKLAEVLGPIVKATGGGG